MKGKQEKKTGAGTGWLFKMAWRDGKASSRRLVLFMASIILGIAALVSIQSFGLNLKDNIEIQSKALMGADYVVDSDHLPNERVFEIMDSLGGAEATEIRFASMAAFPKQKTTKLVQIRGLEGGYPFYGELETQPKEAASLYDGEDGALVDATVMFQFGLQIGDDVKIGNLTFPIIGALKSAPGSSALSSSVAPPIILPYRFIEDTGLIQKGSRIGYNYYFTVDADTDLEKLYEDVDDKLDLENADMDTHVQTSRRLGRRYENVGKFLNLVAFIALLLGCVGIASSVHIYIKEKLRAVAVLKCLGATRRQTFLIFLIQIAGMGLFGGLVGALVGMSIQGLFPLILQDLLPFKVVLTWNGQPILLGLLLGVFMSVLFALSPLLNTWYVSPLQVLRVGGMDNAKSRRASLLVLLGILAFVFLFSLWLLDNWKLALAFVIAILVTFSVLAGAAKLFMQGIKKYFPSTWGFIARQSLLNLFRPNNQTTVLILAIGVGTFLISTLYFTKDILLAKTDVGDQGGNPNIILLDVQTHQKEGVVNSIVPKGLPVIDNIPIVTMRLQSIKGRAVNELKQDTTVTMNKWILFHEFRVTYRDSLIGSEMLTKGDWIPEVSDSKGPIPISLSDNVAMDAQVDIGDRMVFNIQGVPTETVVQSIRKVDWGRMQLNFSVVFPKGVLENAPQFNVLSTKVPDELSSAQLQQELVRKFPNISIIDLRQIITIVEGILDKISWAINFMAFFSILTGIIVLVGSVRTSKYQRIRESVLLRTIGARSRQIMRITALEYFYLGILGSGIGVVLSLIGSQLLAIFVFEVTFFPTLGPFLILLPAITLLVLAIGLYNSRSVIESPPLQVLRKEVK